jgi:hypothetical protein
MKKMMTFALSLFLGLGAASCADRTISGLVGEEGEVARLLGSSPVSSPATSPMAAARRLHQALVQGDSEVSWALLSLGTRDTLTKRAALIGTTGPELLQSSSLPAADGTVIKVNFVSIFFGADLRGLKVDAKDAPTGPDRRVLYAVSTAGAVEKVVFLKEPDGWKVHKSSL